jgi:hypothetical protein
MSRGMIAVQVVISLVPLLGVAAFAIDGGMMFEYRRRVQATADAAALAAANDLYQHYSANAGVDVGGTARSSATLTATANGFSTSTDSTLTVNIPPTSGPYKSKASYAEVILVYNMPRGFSSILGSGTLAIQARAVARGIPATTGGGLYVLDSSGQGAFNDSGGAPVHVNGGNIYVNSTSSKGATASGSGNIWASKLYFSGSPGYSVSGSASFNGTITSNSSPVADPLASLPAPSMSSLTVQANNYSLGGGTATLNPGVYNGGITLSGSSSATLNPGIYYLNGGGLTVSGSASLTANGVMFYNDGGSNGKFTISGSGTITISPPTSGTYAGVTLFQNRTATAQVTVSGGSLVNLTGAFYAAAALANVSGQSTTNLVGSEWVVKDLTVSGSGAVTIGNSSTTSSPRLYGLVE